MDIPAMSMAMSQSRVMDQISIALMDKALEQMKQNGNAMAEQLANMPTGGGAMSVEHIDILV